MSVDDAEIEFIIAVMNEKFSEWLEMAGEKSPELLLRILTKMYIKERNHREYLEKILFQEKKCINE